MQRLEGGGQVALLSDRKGLRVAGVSKGWGEAGRGQALEGTGGLAKGTAFYSEIVGWGNLIKCCMHSVCIKSCQTLCDLMDCSLPGSSVHGIFQASILEWVVISSRGVFPNQGSKLLLSSLRHWLAGSPPLAPPGKPSGV